jgi:hypothetical protein
MARNNEVTGKRAASAASKVLQNPNSSKAAKSAAGSALSQREAPAKVTSKSSATAASKVLNKPDSSKLAKTASGSALTQRPNKKK